MQPQLNTPQGSDPSRQPQGGKSGSESGDKSKGGKARALGAEAAGTFALTFAGAGAEVVNAASGGQVDFVARAAAAGLMVLALIYAWSDISGAHFNPAVTLAFTLRGAFPLARAVRYWAAQLAGAILAGGVLRLLFASASGAALTRPHLGAGPALGMEMVLSMFLVLVIVNTSVRHAEVGTEAPLAVGATIILDGFVGMRVSGASMNPARSLGPALVQGSLHDQWIYLVGPLAGATLAVLLSRLVHGPRNSDEQQAAEGDQMKG